MSSLRSEGDKSCNLQALLVCPCRKKSKLRQAADCTTCSGLNCAFKLGFPRIDGKDILIPFEIEDTIFKRRDFTAASSGKTVVSGVVDRPQGSVRRLMRSILSRSASATRKNVATFIRTLPENPRILIIGGGTIGIGLESIYLNDLLTIDSFDAYLAETVDFVADAHFLPIRNAVYDGVIIQAVLEHVLDPAIVVSELHRVLKQGGIVYAETPFIQQVHEAGYDFTRFTASGHRWLFREFVQLQAGATAGPGTSLAWSIRHFFQMIVGRRIAKVIYIPSLIFFGFVERLFSSRKFIDGASAVFFLGQKQDGFSLKADSMPDYYKSSNNQG